MRVTSYEILLNRVRGVYPLWRIGVTRYPNKVKYSIFNGRGDEVYTASYRETQSFLDGVEYAKRNLILRNPFVHKKELEFLDEI